MAIFFPVRNSGGCGAIHPISNPCIELVEKSKVPGIKGATYLVNYGAFNAFDTYGLLVDTENASTFARSGTDTTSELRKVIRQK